MPRANARKAHAALGIPRAAVHDPVHAERRGPGPRRLPSVSATGADRPRPFPAADQVVTLALDHALISGTPRLQLTIPLRGLGPRSARRRCALEKIVKKVVTGIHPTSPDFIHPTSPVSLVTAVPQTGPFAASGTSDPLTRGLCVRESLHVDLVVLRTRLDRFGWLATRRTESAIWLYVARLKPCTAIGAAT